MGSSPGSEGRGPASSSAAPQRPGRRLAVAAAVVVALAVADGLRPPDRQVAARIALGGIDLYQATLSERLPAVGVSCRFEPTCSRYTEAAIREDGAWWGALRGLGRILRCGPWTEAGTADPP